MASIQVRKETGTLIIDFYYQGKRCREQTLLQDTPANRKRIEKFLVKVEEAIVAGCWGEPRVDCTPDGAHHDGNALPRLFALCPQSHPTRWLGIRASAD